MKTLIEIIIKDRLKLQSVKRNLYRMGFNIDSAKDIKYQIDKIQTLNSKEKARFIIELGGKINYNLTNQFLEDIIYENNVRV